MSAENFTQHVTLCWNIFMSTNFCRFAYKTGGLVFAYFFFFSLLFIPAEMKIAIVPQKFDNVET